MITKDLVTIREYIPTDKDLILPSWLNGLRFGSKHYRKVNKDLYFSFHYLLFDSILDNPNIVKAVAALTEDPDVIIGYVIHDHRTLYWAYVKPAWRQLGIFKSMLPDTIESVRYHTIKAKKCLPRHIQYEKLEKQL